MTDIIYGIYAVEAIIKRMPARILQCYVLAGEPNKRLQPLLEQIKSSDIASQQCSRKQLDELCGGGNHQGIALKCTPADMWGESQLEALLVTLETPFLLVLDCVQDPHNLGACLRSADGAGIDAVIVPRDKAVGLTPTVRKVASGAAETVPLVQVTNLARTLKTLKAAGVWLHGLAEDAPTPIYQADLTGPLALVMGAEGSGLRRLTRDLCDHCFSIPMQGFVSSLNVSVAAGVCLYEAVRQREKA